MTSIKVIVCVKNLGNEKVRLSGLDKYNQFLEYRELSEENVQGIFGDIVIMFIPKEYQGTYSLLLDHYMVVFYNKPLTY